MDSLTIYHDFVINAPINKVFRAITDPEHLENWWPLHCSGKPEKNAIYNFHFSEEHDWYGKVNELEENQKFHIKMTESMAEWDETTFGFDLVQKSDGVKVHFWHSGWSNITDEYRQTSFCWAILLNGLKNYVERGIILPFKDRE